MDQIGQFSSIEAINATRWLQGFVTVGSFVVPALVYFKIANQKLNAPQLFKPVTLSSLGIVLLIGLSALPLIGFIGELNAQMQLPESLLWLEEILQSMEQTATKAVMAMLRVNDVSLLITNLFIVAVLPAVGEELFFRGALQKGLINSKVNKHIAIWLTAAIFSFIHMQFYGFLPRLLLGALFGYLVVWSGSLWYSIWAHFVNNAAGVTIMYLIENKHLGADIETFGANQGDWFYVLISSLVVVGLIALFRVVNLSNENAQIHSE